MRLFGTGLGVFVFLASTLASTALAKDVTCTVVASEFYRCECEPLVYLQCPLSPRTPALKIDWSKDTEAQGLYAFHLNAEDVKSFAVVPQPQAQGSDATASAMSRTDAVAGISNKDEAAQKWQDAVESAIHRTPEEYYFRAEDEAKWMSQRYAKGKYPGVTIVIDDSKWLNATDDAGRDSDEMTRLDRPAAEARKLAGECQTQKDKAKLYLQLAIAFVATSPIESRAIDQLVDPKLKTIFGGKEKATMFRDTNAFLADQADATAKSAFAGFPKMDPLVRACFKDGLEAAIAKNRSFVDALIADDRAWGEELDKLSKAASDPNGRVKDVAPAATEAPAPQVVQGQTQKPAG